MIDASHDRTARSWIAGADGHPDFPIQNLPLCAFRPAKGAPRCGVAIGDFIVDLSGLAATDLLPADLASAARAIDLRSLLALGNAALADLRRTLFALLADAATPEARAAVAPHLHPARNCTFLLPARPGGYTDFYAGIVHATNVGRLLRPDNPLMPNYKWVPIGYHGRSSSIRVSGTDVRRPRGQIKPAPDAPPRLAESDRLDYEVELGLWIGKESILGQPVPISCAPDHIAGVTLLNDWSARDIQAWEYQPLGPFLAKNFATTVSPWLVTMDALTPFRIPASQRDADDPSPLPHLADAADQSSGGLAIEIETFLLTRAMRDAGAEPFRLGRTSSAHLYWTPAQLVAHHASGGCPLEPGDLLGTGTISAPDRDGYGSLMEISRGGTEPLTLPGGEQRRFLEDGDEVIMRGRCVRDGFATIGLGECRAAILPAI